MNTKTVRDIGNIIQIGVHVADGRKLPRWVCRAIAARAIMTLGETGVIRLSTQDKRMLKRFQYV